MEGAAWVTAVTVTMVIVLVVGALWDTRIARTEALELARTKSHGNARELLVLALPKLSSPRLVDTVADLCADPGVGGHALVALGRLVARHRTPVEFAVVKPFLRDGRAWVRRDAKELLALLETLPRG